LHVISSPLEAFGQTARAAVAKTGLALANHMTLPIMGTKTWTRAGRARQPIRRPFKPV